jgi:hypothetical protein
VGAGRGFRGRGGRGPSPPLDQLNDLIADLGINAAQLVLHVDAGLATQIEQIFALHVQLASQRIDANFLFLQAELPVVTLPDPAVRLPILSVPLF